MNALIIDDDPIIVTLVRAMLTSKGYSVTAVESALKVKTLIEQVGVDYELVLIDLQLGEESGFHVYQSSLSSYISLDKIIFMSANSEQDARSLYQLPDSAKFLEKPFRVPDLFNLIF